MYELIQVSEHDFYIDCPAKIGLIRTGDREVVLIDSGNDKDAGKKVYRILAGSLRRSIIRIPTRITSAAIVFCRKKPAAAFMQEGWSACIPTRRFWSRSGFTAGSP